MPPGPGERSSLDDAAWARRLLWLRRWLAVCWLALLAATWRLWTPQVVFPQIPFFRVLRTVPGWVDWVWLTGLAVGLAGLLCARGRPAPPTIPVPLSLGKGVRGEGIPSTTVAPLTASDAEPGSTQAANETAKPPLSRDPFPQGEGGTAGRGLKLSALLSVGATAALVSLDQHRFQPWAYQFLVVALVLGFTLAVPAASLLRVLTVGIYFWSAVSKLDYTFLHAMGPELLRGTLAAFGSEPRFLRPEVAMAIAWAFPLDELAVAALLAVRRTRTVGLVAAVAMHVLLLAGLGPLGLNHSWGVLLWNVYFIGQDILLFRRPASGWRRTAGPGLRTQFREIGRGLVPPDRSAGVGYVAVFLAVWLPALEPFGWLDHWPAWAVYAPAGERVELEVSNDDAMERDFGRAENRWYWGSEYFGAPFRWLDDLWSLDVLSAPVYPDGRFHAGVALASMKRLELRGIATLVVRSRADRFTGIRTTTKHADERSIRDYAESFYLNALPRKLGGW